MAVFTALASAFAAVSSWTISLGAFGTFAIGNFLLRAAVQLGVSALAIAFSGKSGNGAQPFVVQGNVRTGGSVPRSFILGPGLSAGSLVWHSEWGVDGGTPNAYYTQVIALSDLPVAGLRRWFIEGRAVTLEDTGDERGLAAVEYREGGKDHAWIRFHDGTQTLADAFLTGTVDAGAPRGYAANRIGKGIAYAVVTFRGNAELFTGFPNSKFVLDGVKLYDISRDSTQGGTGAQRWADPATWGGDGDELPAVQAYNLARGLTYGGQWFYGLQGLTAARLPAAHWVQQVEKCRAQITGEDGLEPIYRCAGEVTVNSEIGSALEAILTACAGRMSEVGGIFKVYVGAPDAPIAHLTDNEIVSLAPQTFTPFFGLSETVNGVIATYPSPNEGYVMRSTPPIYSAALEAEDGGRRLMTDVQLSFVPYPAQAQRLLTGELAAARRARRHTFTLPAKYRLIEPGDVVTWTSARNGYAAKQFRVDGVIDLPNCDLIVDITEVDPADHGGWVHSLDYVPVTPAALPSVRPTAQGVVGFNPVAVDISDAAGTARRPGLLMQWHGGVDDIAGILFEIRVAATLAVVSKAETRAFDAGELPVEAGLVAATAYEARAKYIPASPRAVSWTSWVGVSTNDVRFGVGDFGPDAIVWSALAQEVRDQVDSAGDANLSAQLAASSEAGALAAQAAAETAQTAAAGSASASAASASASAASQTAAGSEASAAQVSRLAAETAKNNAASSASAAASSASAASASQTAAATSATSASQSANTAGTAAGGASASQTAAASSATNAAGSASAAAASATVASQTLTEFKLINTDFQAVLDGVSALWGVGALETASEGGAVLGQSGSVISATGAGTLSTQATGNGLAVEIPHEQALQFVARRVRIDILARPAASNPAAKFVAGYSTNDNGNSGGWGFTLSADWAWYSFYYTLPAAGVGGSDFIILFGDQDQAGKKTQFARVVVRLAGLAEDIPELGIVQAEASAASLAITDLEGNAAASYVLRAKAGGGVGAVEVAAWANASGGAASKVKLTGSEIEFDGLSVFNNVLKSSNYSAGAAGWQIKSNGDAEFNNLVVRSWVQDGAVSDGCTYSNDVAMQKLNGSGIGNSSVGEMTLGKFFQIAARISFRPRLIYGVWQQVGGDGHFNIMCEQTRVVLQMRTKASGIWSGYVSLHDFGWSGTTPDWVEKEIIVSRQGAYEDAQVRLLVWTQTVVSGSSSNDPGSTTYNNIDDVSLIAKALVR